MLLGSFDVPEIRLVPNAIDDIKLIYDNFQLEKTKSSDLASTLGYQHATASRFYLRLKAMNMYGLLDGRNNYKVTELGKSIAYPESDTQQKELRTKSILNISLWSELYKKYKKSPPKENFWIQIKNITGMEPKKAQSVQTQILKWYLDDISHISDGFEIQSKDITLGTPLDNPMSQQLISSTNTEIISFDRYEVKLPKGDLSKEWKKLKKYMDIKLEDYKYEEPKVELENTNKD